MMRSCSPPAGTPWPRRACPVEALKAWLEAAAITEGAVFGPIAKGGRIQPTRLTDRSVAHIVKAHARRAGLDPKIGTSARLPCL